MKLDELWFFVLEFHELGECLLRNHGSGMVL